MAVIEKEGNTMTSIKKDRFEWVGPNKEKSEGISRPSINFWQDAFIRLKKNKAALVCMGIIVFILLMAIFVPIFSPYTISEQHMTHQNKGMFYVAEDGHMHLFGTDQLGRDLFVRIWSGARISLTIAFVAVFVNLIVGMIYGGVAGYVGGMTDNIMMRIVEVINGIPYLMVVILLTSIMSTRGVARLIIAYAATGWTGMARLVRGQVIQLKEQEFITAAKLMGAKPMRIILKHLLPNTLSVVIVNITLAIPSAIFTEAYLSFIGLGVSQPMASWGTLANEGVQQFRIYPHEMFVPAFFICITMLAFNLLGDGLRDAFDPRLRR